MRHRLVHRKHFRDAAFTLIELLVVILILGILLAVAAPSFLGQQNKAKDSQAKQMLAVGYRDAKAEAKIRDDQFVDASCTAACLASAIQTAEPQYGTVATATGTGSLTAGQLTVISSNTSGSNLQLAVKSKSGAIWTLTVTGSSSPVIAEVAAGTYPQAIAADGASGFWKLDEASGTTAADSAGSGPGTIGSAVTLGQPGAYTGSTSGGFVNNNANSAVTLGTGYDFAGNAPFSVEAWVYRTSTAVPQYIVDKSTNPQSTGWFLRISGGSSAQFGRLSTGPTLANAVSTTALATNTWYHVVGVYNGATLAIYVNGTAETSVADSGTAIASTSPVLIGKRTGDSAQSMVGRIDDVAIYPVALTGSQVRNHYTCATAGTGC